MPSFKLTGAKSQEVKSGFEAYDGPEPTRKGFYRAVIKKMTWGLNKKSGSYGFTIVSELEAAKGDPKEHAMFDGFPMFSQGIITEGANGADLKEGSVKNLSNLLAALGAKDEPNVVLEQGGDPDEAKVTVLKIDGKNPVGTVINIDMAFGTYEGEKRPEVGGIFKYKGDDAPAAKKGAKLEADPDEDEDSDDEADLMEGADDAAEDGEEMSEEERREELKGYQIADLKKILKDDYDLPVGGPKSALIDRIVEHEYAEGDEEDSPAALDEDEPDDADEAEDADEADDDEDDDEGDEEEGDEDDEARAEREAELAEFDRTALKAVLKEVAPDFKPLKRHTDDDFREAILHAEFGSEETPF